MKSSEKRKRRRRREQRACRDKVAYDTELSAARAAARTDNTWYRCPYCHKWHLTSKYKAV